MIWKNYLINYTTKFLFFFLVVTAGVIASCGGTRATTKNRTELKKDSISINNNIELRQNSSLYDVLRVNPVDISKPVVINGISYYNASITYDKSKFENFEILDKSILSQTSKIEKTTNKETDRKDNTLLYIGLFSVFLIFIYFYIKTPR